MPKLALIHTVGSLPPVFAALAEEALPGVDRTDLVDESLLGDTIAAGSLQAATRERLASHVEGAIRDGADLVLVTCSSMGPAVDDLASRGLPVLRVDEALADAAVRTGARIGVIATLSTTLEPTTALVRRRAEALGQPHGEVEIVTELVDGAFAELRAGNLERHDELVRDGLRRLIPRVDVVVLAQASMARVAAQLEDAERNGRPILASPALGIERAAERLGLRAAAGT